MESHPSQVDKSESLPFFSRENLLLTTLDTQNNASFSFEPFTNEARSSNQIKSSYVMKIDHIMDISREVASNSSNSSRLKPWKYLCPQIDSYYALDSGSETFALHYQSLINPPVDDIVPKPARRHQVRHEF